MSAKTVFLSYRRDSVGRAFARSLKQELTHHGYDVFLDVDHIGAGSWADQILTEVPLRSHIILLLTPGALDRCVNDDDWGRQEFALAVRSGRNIVPVSEESVNLAELRQNCPEAMKGLFKFQVVPVQHAGFEEMLKL